MQVDGDVDGLIGALSAAKIERSPRLRSAVIIAFGRLGDRRAVPVVTELLASDSSDSVRRLAAKTLGEYDSPEALSALRTALADESETVQLWAIQSIGQLQDRESVERLIGMLESPDRGFRQFAATALGAIGDQRATGPLLNHIQDRSGTVRLAVLSALRRLGDSRAIGPLRQARDVAGWRNRRRLDAALADLEARFA